MLVVVEQPAARQVFADLLGGVCHVSLVSAGEDALIALTQKSIDLILVSDRLYGTISREQLVREVQSLESDLPVFVFTHKPRPSQSSAQEGVSNVFSIQLLKTERGRVQLVLSIERAISERSQRRQQNMRERRSRRAALSVGNFLVGPSNQIAALRDDVQQASESELNLLLTGETGVGKSLVTESVHRNGPRADAPLVITEPATMPATLFASEFFGHVRGAFTGATTSQIGAFEAANGGTLVLDEIGDLESTLQTQLLRAVESKTIRRLGDPREIQLDVRIVTATNRDLESDVSQGLFREDLFFRLNETRMHIPPLRERQEDVVPLFKHFIASFSGEPGFEIEVAADAVELLTLHGWPGNVREVRTLARRLLDRGRPDHVDAVILSGLFPARVEVVEQGLSLDDRLATLKRRIYIDELAKHGNNIRDAARGLGMPYTTLRSRLKSLGLLDRLKEKRQ